METTGKIKDVQRDFHTNKLIISFIVDSSPVEEINKLSGCDALDITAKRHRNKRSLNANAYFHVLVGDIAKAINASNIEVKNRLIREYGAYEFICGQIPTFRLKAEYEDEILNKEGLHVTVIGREHVDGDDFVRCAFMRGSHTYNTEEMSRLIDGTVTEAKGLGIDTLPPNQLERMIAAWENHGK